MNRSMNRYAFCFGIISAASLATAQTYGNTTPFETYSNHSPDYVLGVQVTIPQSIVLQSFGLIYGLGANAASTTAIFGLYSSDPAGGLPMTRVANTNPVTLNAAQIYDNLSFTSTPTVAAGTYWMMALYQGLGNPRMSTLNSTSLVAYWSNPYSSGMPGTAPGITTYQGQNFNYWVNGSPVPEPATATALALGLAAAFRRRKAR